MATWLLSVDTNIGGGLSARLAAGPEIPRFPVGPRCPGHMLLARLFGLTLFGITPKFVDLVSNVSTGNQCRSQEAM